MLGTRQDARRASDHASVRAFTRMTAPWRAPSAFWGRGLRRVVAQDALHAAMPLGGAVGPPGHTHQELKSPMQRKRSCALQRIVSCATVHLSPASCGP